MSDAGGSDSRAGHEAGILLPLLQRDDGEEQEEEEAEEDRAEGATQLLLQKAITKFKNNINILNNKTKHNNTI